MGLSPALFPALLISAHVLLSGPPDALAMTIPSFLIRADGTFNLTMAVTMGVWLACGIGIAAGMWLDNTRAIRGWMESIGREEGIHPDGRPNVTGGVKAPAALHFTLLMIVIMWLTGWVGIFAGFRTNKWQEIASASKQARSTLKAVRERDDILARYESSLKRRRNERDDLEKYAELMGYRSLKSGPWGSFLDAAAILPKCDIAIWYADNDLEAAFLTFQLKAMLNEAGYNVYTIVDRNTWAAVSEGADLGVKNVPTYGDAANALAEALPITGLTVHRFDLPAGTPGSAGVIVLVHPQKKR